jgi:serine kinase of HPr protein (carbohydrate metabolism regulator)
MTANPSIHATAILAGARAILIRGPSGSGKSKLALQLLQAASSGALAFTRLIGDDRVIAQAHHGRLLLRPAPSLEGLLEIRGIGIRTLPFEPVGVAGLVVDLAADDAARMPGAAQTEIEGIRLTRLAVAAQTDPFPLVMALLGAAPASTAPYKPA